MAVSDNAMLEELLHRVSRGQRAAVLRTGVVSLGIVVVAALFLWFTLRQLSDVQAQLQNEKAQLTDVEARIDKALAAQTEAEKSRDAAEASAGAASAKLKDAEAKLTDADAQVAQLKDQVSALQSQIGRLQDQLKSVLDLDRYTYKLEWRDLKSIAVHSGDAYQILGVIDDRRKTVHWGMSNTPDGGYNSPGFARLVWDELRPSTPFNQLPRASGDPLPGDVVIYESGYYMFFFRDYERKPFVVGMTPFGVTALNYDFGVKVVAVLRTGLNR
jgi:hypothetical protein